MPSLLYKTIDMSSKTRRDFLQLFGSALAAATLAKSSPLWSEAVAAPRPVKVWITSELQKFAPVDAPTWTAAASKDSESFHIDPMTWYHEVLGFGGAFTDASCYLFYQLNPEDRKALFNELFG